MYRSLFGRDLFAELDRLQREMQQAFDLSPSIRGYARGGYPALNVGGTPKTVEIYAFAPGLDPASIDVQIERGVLTLSGERRVDQPAPGPGVTVHTQERFAGPFRRVMSLPDDLDASSAAATYRDGVLRVTLQRSAAAQPRRIEIQ